MALTLTLAEEQTQVPENAVVKEFATPEQALAYVQVISGEKDIFEEEKPDEKPRR